MKNLMAKRMPLIMLALVLGFAACENAASPDSSVNDVVVGFTNSLASLLDNSLSADPYTNVNNEVAFRKGHGEMVKVGGTTTTITIPPGVTLSLNSEHYLEVKKSAEKPTTKAEFIFTGGGTLRLDGKGSLKAGNANITFDGITLAVTSDETIDAGDGKVTGKGQLGYKIEGTVSDYLSKGSASYGALLTAEAAGTTVDLIVMGTFQPQTKETAWSPVSDVLPLKNIRNMTFDSGRQDAVLDLSAGSGTLISLANASNITGNGRIVFSANLPNVATKGINAKGELKISSGITLAYGSAKAVNWVDITGQTNALTGKNITLEDGATVEINNAKVDIKNIKDLVYDGTAKKLRGSAIGLVINNGSLTLGEVKGDADNYSGLRFQNVELKADSAVILRACSL